MLVLLLIQSPDDTLSFATISQAKPLPLPTCKRLRLVGVYADQAQVEAGERRVMAKLAHDLAPRDREATGSMVAHFSTGGDKAVCRSESTGLVPNGWHPKPDWATELVCEGVILKQPAPQPDSNKPAVQIIDPAPGDLDDLLVAGPGPQAPYDPHQELGAGLAY